MRSLFFCLTMAACCSCDYAREEPAESESGKLTVALKEIRQMDSCRIKAENRDFYLHRYKAEKILSEYQNKRRLSRADHRALARATSNLAFARVDYLFQVGKYERARQVMDDLASNATLNLYSDTTQWLKFLCYQGKVHYQPYHVSENKKSILQGYDSIVQAYILASRSNDAFFKALSMQLLSSYLLNDSILQLANTYDRASIRYVNEDNMPDSLLAGNLAERSLSLFLKLNNPYHTADAWRNLAECYFDIGNAQRSIDCLFMAISNPATDSMPDLLATVNEQLSLSFASLNDKHNSDFYRNVYLDLQDSTRQDRELEARAVALEESTTKIWYLVACAFSVFLMLCILTVVLIRIRRRKEAGATEEKEMLEQLSEDLQARRLQYSNALRSAVEQRARLSVVGGMLPLIDRMKLAIYKGDMSYATELADEIDRQNAMLTRWIKLRKGIIEPKIETFPLQDILLFVSKNGTMLSRQGITLITEPTTLNVKADRTLTLFIVNTLIDNARKAIGSDGTISVSCTENREWKYAEISVADTGKGMTEQQVEHLFEYKVIRDSEDTTSHGFGLVNCRGIIDRYRKLSSLFSVCTISATSALGKGSVISFRLPLAVKMLVGCLLLTINGWLATPCHAQKVMTHNDSIAARYCDSLYRCNIVGRYEQAILYADSCRTIVERDSTVDTGIRLSLYNETAVAALALHQWQRYTYNNYLFTQLYKEQTSDSTLPLYCQTMERNELKANIAMLVVILLTVALFPIIWFTYLRHVIRFHRELRHKRQLLKEEMLKTQQEYDHLHIISNITDNQLSTLKHETMYYPVRIRQLIASGETGGDLTDTVDYYRDLYSLLSTQAINQQAASFTFHTSRIELRDLLSAPGSDGIAITANRELMTYLLLLLRRHNGGKAPACTVAKTYEKYVTLDFRLAAKPLPASAVDTLFSTATVDVDFLIMRQIVRETGKTAMRYGAGITARSEDGATIISVTLPRHLYAAKED